MFAHDMIHTLASTKEGSDERDSALDKYEPHLVGYNVFPKGAEPGEAQLVLSVFDDGSISLLIPPLEQGFAVTGTGELYQVIDEAIQRYGMGSGTADAVMAALGFIPIPRDDETVH